MSTSLIYHAFGLQGYEYVHQQFVGGRILFRVRPKAKLLCCFRCKSYRVIRRGMRERMLRTLPIGFKPVWLLVEVPRLKCLVCGCLRSIRLGIAAPRRWYTRSFERFVLALTKVMTLKDISRLIGIGWDCVKDILKRHLAGRFWTFTPKRQPSTRWDSPARKTVNSLCLSALTPPGWLLSTRFS